MSRDAYQTFIGAKGVAFTWIGAAIGPVFLRIGLDPDYGGHLVIGVVSLLLVAVSVFDGIKASRAKSMSGFIAFTVVPLALLVAGTVFALLAED